MTLVRATRQHTEQQQQEEEEKEQKCEWWSERRVLTGGGGRSGAAIRWFDSDLGKIDHQRRHVLDSDRHLYVFPWEQLADVRQVDRPLTKAEGPADGDPGLTSEPNVATILDAIGDVS